MKTMPEETYQGMTFTLVTQYINMTLVLFLVNYRFTGIEDSPTLSAFIDGLPFFNGKHEDFTINWYRSVGAAMTLTLVMQIIVPQLGNALPYLLYSIRRCVDRGCRCNS